jgi:hypothetical protein
MADADGTTRKIGKKLKELRAYGKKETPKASD